MSEYDMDNECELISVSVELFLHSLAVHPGQRIHISPLDREILSRVITMSLFLGRRCVPVRLASSWIDDSEKTAQYTYYL